MEKVSVIIATYRRDEELKRALVSVAEQTYTNIEVIVVDDNGNEDWNQKVAASVEQIQAAYPALKIKTIVNSTNFGSAKTRNVGITNSSGYYITFLDDDDLYLPEKVAKQTAFMESGEYDYSITDLYLYNKNDKIVDKRIRNYIKEYTKEALTRYHLMHHITGTDTLMFKRDYLCQIDGFGPANVGDEYYLIQKAIDQGGKFGYLPGCEVKAYIHTDDPGVSSGNGKILGEKALFKHKKLYFKYLDLETKKYIRMRHYAVLAFAEIRRKRIIAFLLNACLSFLNAPIQCCMLIFDRFFGSKKTQEYESV